MVFPADHRCGEQVNAVVVGQVAIRSVAVLGFVADQSCREGIEEAVPEDPSSWLSCGEALSILTARVIIGESENFRSFAAFGGPDREALFFAPV